MRAQSIWALALVILASFAISRPALSAEIAVLYSVDRYESDGESVQGTMTVQVFNLSGGDLKNVDLRLDLGGMNAIARRVIQFGHVAAGAGGVAQARFLLDQALFDEMGALPWRADFDDALGNHSSVVVIAPRSQ